MHETYCLPLTTPRALSALAALLDPPQVRAAVEHFDCWAELANATPAHRTALLGAGAASVVVPAECPELDNTSGTEVLSRWDDGFPTSVADDKTGPVVLWVQGAIPAVRVVAIGGTNYPSEDGFSVARDAARQAVQAGWAVAGVADNKLGSLAVTIAAEAGGSPIVVAPSGLRQALVSTRLFDVALEAGGCAISAEHLDEPWSEHTAFRAERLLVGLANVVVAAEVGATPASGTHLVETTHRRERILVVPKLTTEALSATGSAVLAGPAARREGRVVVASGPQDLADLLR